MNRMSSTLSGLLFGTLLAAAPGLRAEEGHDHSKHDHATHDHAPVAEGAVMSSHDGMSSLYKHVGEMETEITAGKMDGIHGHDEAIQAAVKDLDKDTTLTADKKKRVQGYVKNVLKLSGKLHAAADGKKFDQAKKDLVKLKAQVDLLDKQFAHSHKPGAAQPAKEADHHAHPAK